MRRDTGRRDTPAAVAVPRKVSPAVRSVSSVVLTPGHPTTWYLLAEVRVTRAGTFLVKGVTVRYRAGGRTGSQRYTDQLLVTAR